MWSSRGSKKAVSERLNSMAILRSTASGRVSLRTITAAGLPENGLSVKASTVWKARVVMSLANPRVLRELEECKKVVQMLRDSIARSKSSPCCNEVQGAKEQYEAGEQEAKRVLSAQLHITSLDGKPGMTLQSLCELSV